MRGKKNTRKKGKHEKKGKENAYLMRKRCQMHHLGIRMNEKDPSVLRFERGRGHHHYLGR
jgi:hypothetical protein